MNNYDLSKNQWMKHPLWAIILTLVGFFSALLLTSVLIGAIVSLVIGGNGGFGVTFGNLMIAICVSIAALLIVYFLRKLANQPWSGLRLKLKWGAVPEFISGFILAFIVILLIDVISVMLGSAEWKSWDGSISIFSYFNLGLLSIIGVILVQAFPEELFFRGHLFDTLSYKFSYKLVLLITSVVFGSFHIFSQSPAEGIGEKLLYVLFAMTFGFILAACRWVKQSLWLPIGFHAGQDFLSDLLVTFDYGSFSIHLIIMIVFMTLTGFLVLKTHKFQITDV